MGQADYFSNGGFTAFPEELLATPFTAWFGSVEKLKGRFNVLSKLVLRRSLQPILDSAFPVMLFLIPDIFNDPFQILGAE